MPNTENDRFDFNLGEGLLVFSIGWKSLMGVAVLGFAVATIIFACNYAR